jgi:hypothetical protein
MAITQDRLNGFHHVKAAQYGGSAVPLASSTRDVFEDALETGCSGIACTANQAYERDPLFVGRLRGISLYRGPRISSEIKPFGLGALTHCRKQAKITDTKNDLGRLAFIVQPGQYVAKHHG